MALWKFLSIRIFVFLVVGPALIACEKGVPEFDQLKDLPQPTFNGKTKSSIRITSSSASIPVEGECDARIKSINSMIDEVHSTWSELSALWATSGDADCSDGTFSFSLKSLDELGYWDTSQPQAIRLLVRGNTAVGATKASELTIHYAPVLKGNNKDMKITSGSETMKSSSHVLKGRISTGRSSKVMSSSQHAIVK